MFIGELTIRRNNINKKIKELEIYLYSLPTDEADSKGGIYRECLDRVFVLLEEYQRYTLLLGRYNFNNGIKVGDSEEVDISSALVLIRTLVKKMGVIDRVIKNNDHSIDVFKLIEQRDSLMEEYILLKAAIYKNDWSSEIE